jgi:uncharacterized protein
MSDDSALAEKVAFLSSPSAYPGATTAVERLETHMSWVFLTADRVYKLKKPVRFEFLDFSTLTAREAMCRAEVQLNRRLAPDVYLGVVPIVRTGDGLSIGGAGQVADWLVVMRRLDSREMLDRRIGVSRLEPARWLARWRRSIRLNNEILSRRQFELPMQAVARVDRAQRLFVERFGRLLTERARAGRIVDGHGDLRPEHIWMGDGIKVIDCLEFNAGLRCVDPLQELAFLDLECRRLGAASGAGHLPATVCRRLKDDAPKSLFVFYRCYAATLRARLAMAHTLEPETRLPEKWRPLAKSYLTLASDDAKYLERLIRAPKGPQCRALGGAALSRRRAAARRSVLQAARARGCGYRGE